MSGPVHGDLALGHRLEQCGLRPGRGAVDLVRQQEPCEDRSGPELEAVLDGVPQRYPNDVARQQVRRELHAPEVQPESAGHCLGEDGLARSRGVPQEHVALREEAEQQQPDKPALPLDDLLDVGGDRLERRRETRLAGERRCRFGVRVGHVGRSGACSPVVLGGSRWCSTPNPTGFTADH